MTYELDWQRYYEPDTRVNAIGILTGHDTDEILAVCPKTAGWKSASFKGAFHALGFNTNPRFIAFDPDTEYPCLMRFKDSQVTGNYWYCMVYYQGMVYGDGRRFSFNWWVDNHPTCRITSMLQVWI
jgi:hypothetical protein